MLDFQRSTKPTTVIPLTSLIDVMLFLVIFFMLTTKFMVIESMELSVPSLQPAPSGEEAKTMTQIRIDNDGSLQIERAGAVKNIGKAQLNDALHALLREHPNEKILVLTADNVAVQTLVSVMDVVYQAGGKNLAIDQWKIPSIDAIPDAAAPGDAAPDVSPPPPAAPAGAP